MMHGSTLKRGAAAVKTSPQNRPIKWCNDTVRAVFKRRELANKNPVYQQYIATQYPLWDARKHQWKQILIDMERKCGMACGGAVQLAAGSVRL